MIETIFYFAKNPAEYESNKDLLSPRTISFVPNADGTNAGKIYKDKIEYGSGSTFELEQASDTKLGGIKIGYTPNGNNYPVRLDNLNRAYVNVPSTGGGGSTTTIENRYDDTAIWESVNRALHDLDDLEESLDGKIANTITNALSKYSQFLEMVENGDANWGEVFEYGHGFDTAMQSYLRGLGFINQNGQAKWSEIEQSIEEIRGTVAALSSFENGDIETFKSEIITAVLNNQAITSLTSSWVYTHGADILSAISGFESTANQAAATADMFARYKDSNDSAIAAVQAKANANEASISTIARKLGSSAGVASEVNLDKAVATLFATDGTTPDSTRAAVSAMIQDGVSEVVVNADKIALIADAVNVDADTTISGNILAKRVVDGHGGIIVDADGVIIPLHDVIFNQSDSGLYWKSRPAMGRGSDSSSSDENTPTFSGVDHYIKATSNGWDIYPAIGGTTSGATADNVQILNGTLTFTNGVLTNFSQHNDNLNINLS